jgi:DNA-binding CsgD family transcriptional regulator
VVLGGLMLRRALRERHKAEEQLRRASGAFMDLLHERFGEWGLTPSEKDVALFAIKGMSTAEIASLRATSEGTVKAQTNAIYRKAGVSGRSQLLSLFIEDLMRDDGAVRPMPTPLAETAVSAK